MTSRRTVGLVVDSGTGMRDEVAAGLAVLPLRVVIGGETLDDSAGGDLYGRLRRGERATTSTPSPGDYLGAFDALAAAGYTSILCLTIPSQWSGMHDSALVARRVFDDRGDPVAVHVLETTTAAAGFGLVARGVDSLCAGGASLDEALARVARACEDVRMYGALATLEFVARSGRVPSLLAGVSDALRVRPVFEMHRGRTGRVGLARTDGGVLRTLERVAGERFPPPRPIWLMVFHADAAAMAGRLGDRIAARCTVARRETVALAPVIGVHIGPGAVGFAALPADEDDPAAAH